MKKGFASAGMIYTLLVIFLIVTITMITTIQNKKTSLDKLKNETADTLYCNQNVITELTKKIETLEEEIIKYDEEIITIKQTGNVNESDILIGKTVYSGGNIVTGTMNDISGQVSAKDVKTFDDVKKVGLQINTIGYYDSKNNIYVSTDELFKKIGLTSDVIVEGEEIFGIIGTYKKSYAATTYDANKKVTTTNCRDVCQSSGPCCPGASADDHCNCNTQTGVCYPLATCCYESSKKCDTITTYSCNQGDTRIETVCYSCPNGGMLNSTDNQCYF